MLTDADADVGSEGRVLTGKVQDNGVELEPQVLLPRTETVTLPDPLAPTLMVTAVAVPVKTTGEPAVAIWLLAVRVALVLPVTVTVHV